MANPTSCEQIPGDPFPQGGKLLTDKQKLTDGITAWRTILNSAPINSSIFTAFLDFDKQLIQQILSVTDCTGIRIFPVMDGEGKHSVTIVPKNSNGDEIFSDSIEETSEGLRNMTKGTGQEETIGMRDLVSRNLLDSGTMACCPRNGRSNFIEGLQMN